MEDLPKEYNNKKTLFYVLGVVIFFLLFYFFALSAPFGFAPGTIVKVDQGMGLRSVSLRLKNENIIRSRLAFEAFAIIFGGDRHIMFADYLFENKLPVYGVAWRIARGEHHMPAVIVTIPEGFDVVQIAEAYSAKLTNFNKTKFLTDARPKEGYLFPDTYFFLNIDDGDDVLRAMSDNFNKKIEPILPSIATSGKTENQIMIMASIIEREAKGDKDRAIISGILWHRLSIGMPLQVDAAPGTYKTKGLPKNPICNPGLEAIKAAINSVASPYLYYLHDKDGNVHYAKNFIEHQANIKKYLK